MANCTTIFFCHRPTNASYDKLASLVEPIPKRNVLNVAGDMNAPICKDINNSVCLLNSTNNTGWNDKIVVLKKTTLQLYFKTFIEKKSIQVT